MICNLKPSNHPATIFFPFASPLPQQHSTTGHHRLQRINSSKQNTTTSWVPSAPFLDFFINFFEDCLKPRNGNLRSGFRRFWISESKILDFSKLSKISVDGVVESGGKRFSDNGGQASATDVRDKSDYPSWRVFFYKPSVVDIESLCWF